MPEKMIRSCLIVFLYCAAAHAQEGARGVQQRGMLSRTRSASPAITSQEWKSNRLIAAALSHLVLAPSAPVPGGDGRDSAVLDVLRKQSAAAHAVIIAVRPADAIQGGTLLNGGTKQAANSQLLPTTASNVQSGPTRHQAPSSPQTQRIGAQAPPPTQVCMAGIASVDGQKSGILFSPVPGPEGMFVIQGCGFGIRPGEVFLTGPQYVPMLASATR